MTIVHHLNCCTMRPPSAQLINGQGGWTAPGRMVAHCLLIETNDAGLILVDSGIGTRDIERPERLGKAFLAVVNPVLDPRETAFSQVKALGYKPSDVRHVVLTHMDVDHAGGISDFPDAQVHIYQAEYDACMQPNWREKERYRRAHWEHGPNWALHDDDGESFMDLSAVRAIAEPDVLLVPTTGHSRGHAAVAVNTREGWLLHCGDAYFHGDEMGRPPKCPAGLRLFQTVVASSNEDRLHNQERLRDLRRKHKGEVTVFCAHDQHELAFFSN